MSSAIKRELTWIIGFIWVGFFFAWITQWWIVTSLLLFVAYFARQFWSLQRFERWMQGDPKVHYPPTSGMWSEISYLVSRKQRALEKHVDLNLYKSKQFRAASMQLPIMIISLDYEERIEWFNDSAKKQLQLSRTDQGRKINGFLRMPEFLSYLEAQDWGQPIQIQLPLKPGFIHEVRVIPYFEDHKLVLISDITGLYKMAQIRRDFVANASHELRTPLTVLHGYLEIMLDSTEPDSPWFVPLGHMANQSQRMQSIIEDLLTLSQLEADAITSEHLKVSLSDLVQGIEKDAKTLLGPKHTLSVEIEPNLEIQGHVQTLKSLFMNLVSNAIRYSPDGGEVSIRLVKRKGAIEFSVTDQGMGIAAEHIPRLTERFYRVDKARSRVTGGTGLGLAIVKHALEKHHAELNIESHLGQGSTFSCRFPDKAA